MDTNVTRMEEQLKLWGVKINHAAAKTQPGGAWNGYDAWKRVDGLRGLHAIAQSNLDKFSAAGEKGRATLLVEMTRAWNDLAMAMKHESATP